MEEAVEIKLRNIISPWRDVAEFREVSEWIYGDEANMGTWNRAIDELRVWINRRRSQCPAGVYATHAMLEVKLADECNNMEPDVLRSLYAFALLRFFNFMSSTVQTHNMRSMYATAIALGLESFVVDIRHICAHGTELPEISILRSTTDYCLNWLHGYFWKKQNEKMIDATASYLQKSDRTLQKCAKDLGKLFGLYDSVLECYLNRCTNIKEIKQNLNPRYLTIFKEFWISKKLDDIRDIFDTIIMDMVAIIKSGVSRKHIRVILAREFMKMKFFFTVSKTHGYGAELEELIDVVQNLFRFLAVYNVIEIILQRLFETAESSSYTSEDIRVGTSFWAKQIVDGFAIFIRGRKMYSASYNVNTKEKIDYTALNFGIFSKKVRDIYICCGVDMNRSIIFGDSFQRPWVWHFNRYYLNKRVKAVNKYTASILPCLWTLVKPKMNADEIAVLEKLIKIYLNEDGQENGLENEHGNDIDKIYTIRDVIQKQAASEELDQIEDGIESEHLSGWRSVEYDDYDWSQYPIGRLPWQ